MRHLLRKLTMVKGMKRLQKVSGANVCSEVFKNNTQNGNYREAVKTLNQLQTNASVLQEIQERRNNNNITVERSESVPQTQMFLSRSGISLEELDSLPVIHVAGTKGKGSTCALCESILRHYGLEKTKQSSGCDLPSPPVRTGLYTSPHLIEVRERIQLNGTPVSHEMFAMYFWKVYNALMETRENDTDMPSYFKFLTVLAFNIFLMERVDVAIIEVGIGGEHDCTNIIRNPIAVGITSLGFDHEKILGDTLEKIAWQKAGIMKKGSPAFTALGQPPNALGVLEERAKEKEVILKVCPPLSSYSFGQSPLNLPVSSPIQEVNASLALQLANAWIKWHTKSSNEDTSSVTSKRTCVASPFELDVRMNTGLRECKWPGRVQILRWDNDNCNSSETEPGQSFMHDPGTIFFLDGAHTVESVNICLEWFKKESHALSTIGSKESSGDSSEVEGEVQKVIRVLLFNSTGNRNIEMLLIPFAESKLFNFVLFSPNCTKQSMDLDSDLISFKTSHEQVNARCKEHQDIWAKHNQEAQVNLYSCVTDALASLRNLPTPFLTASAKQRNFHVLVTGSLHLVGSVLSIVDPGLSQSLSQKSFHK